MSDLGQIGENSEAQIQKANLLSSTLAQHRALFYDKARCFSQEEFASYGNFIIKLDRNTVHVLHFLNSPLEIVLKCISINLPAFHLETPSSDWLQYSPSI